MQCLALSSLFLQQWIVICLLALIEGWEFGFSGHNPQLCQRKPCSTIESTVRLMHGISIPDKSPEIAKWNHRLVELEVTMRLFCPCGA